MWSRHKCDPATMNPAQKVSTLWKLIEEAFDRLCDAYNSRQLIPLLEADVAAYVYHSLVSIFDGDASRIHLETRLLGAPANEKYDLVIGDVLSTDEIKRLVLDRLGDNFNESDKRLLRAKSSDADFRPAVRGELTLEFKIFAVGFTPQQLSVHQKQAVEDIGKLCALKGRCPHGRGSVLFDDTGYLTAIRKQNIVDACDMDDSELRIYLFERRSGAKLSWFLLRPAVSL